MGNIISNIKAQSQEIYKSAKSLILEDNLIGKSLDDSIGKVWGKTQKDYVNSINVLKELGTITNLENLTKTKGDALKKMPEEMSILGNSLEKEQLRKVGQAVANKSAIVAPGWGTTVADETYSKLLKKTKGSIGRNMAGSVLGNYYINPFKDGLSAINNTKFKDNNRLHQGMTRAGLTVGGAALGGYGIGAITGRGNDNQASIQDSSVNYNNVEER